MRKLVSLWIVLLVAGGVAADDPPLPLYEWLRPARVVIGGRVEARSGKFTYVSVQRNVRGDLTPGEEVRLLVRRANLERGDQISRLKLEEGGWYLFLLDEVVARPDDPRTFELVRGTLGARRVPAETAGRLLDAATRFASIQDEGDERASWRAFRNWLEETDPLLIETALGQFERYRRHEEGLIPILDPLLDHPDPTIRAASLRLTGRIVVRHLETLREPSEVRGRLLGLARGDEVTAVRVAATEALAGLRDEATERLLEEIARSDPEQEVRFAAERLLFAWREEESDI